MSLAEPMICQLGSVENFKTVGEVAKGISGGEKAGRKKVMHGSGWDFGIQPQCYLKETEGCVIRGSINKPWKLEKETKPMQEHKERKQGIGCQCVQAEKPGALTYFFWT